MQESINFISMTEPKTRVYVTSEISDKPILMQVDTGVSCNVIPDKYLPPGTLINETERTLRMYSKYTMAAFGTFKLSMRNPKNRMKYIRQN